MGRLLESGHLIDHLWYLSVVALDYISKNKHRFMKFTVGLQVTPLHNFKGTSR